MILNRQRRFLPYLLALISGIMLWLAWPERGFTPLIFIALVPLFFAERNYKLPAQRRGLRLFLVFFIAMLTWNSLTTWWIYNATGPGSIIAIALNSLFMAVPWFLFHIIRRGHGAGAGYASLIFFWIGFEYLHLNWEISWPWLTLGNAFAIHPAWVQWFEYSGTLGGTLWILIVNMLFYQLLKNLLYRDLLLRLRRINVFLLAGAVCVFLCVPLLFSVYLYHSYEETGEPAEVVILQPNVDPYNEKFNGTELDQITAMLRLAETEIDSNTQYCIGPETALPDGLGEARPEDAASIKLIRKTILMHPGLNLILGATTYKTYLEGEKLSVTARKPLGSDIYYDAYNSGLLLSDNHAIQIYHKSRLVPGVEKMPYPKLFGFLERYAIEMGGTSGSLGTQENRTNFIASDGTRIAPAICYESIYGDFMSGYMRDTAEFIAVITNDGWWGNTPGYRQHMNYSRLRAIEFRKDIARSANTGISCFINQRGDILQQTGWWEEATLKDYVYKNKVITFYARHGDYLGFACAFLAVTLIIYLIVRRMIQWF